jgi:hypothetical protein
MPGNSAKVRRGGSGKNKADYFINYGISTFAQLCFNHYFARISGIFQERGAALFRQVFLVLLLRQKYKGCIKILNGTPAEWQLQFNK